MTDIILTSLKETSMGCPSRWTGTTSDKELFSAGYDRGMWSIYVFLEGRRRKIGSGIVCTNRRSRTCAFWELKAWAQNAGVNIYDNYMDALSQSQTNNQG